MTTMNLTGSNFEEVVTSKEIVLIDFWASWCGPCRNFAPIYDAASERHPDITFAKVDTDAEQELASAAQISSIPTIMAIREGIPVFAQAGALPAEALEDVIAQLRALDMNEVREQVAAAQAGAGAPQSGQTSPSDVPQAQTQTRQADQAGPDHGAGVDYPDANGAIV